MHEQEDRSAPSWLAVAAVFAACCAYFLLFRRYGFQVEDEGTLLFQLDRASRGQLPYTDFHTGYTPGFFVAGAWLLDLLGHSTDGLRVALAVMNAATATALFVVARYLLGPWMAVIPVAAWVAFIPVFTGEFAAFNIPYPAWPATLAWMAVALSLFRWTDRGEWPWLVAAGVAAAAAFAVKPNAGAFALAASVWVVTMFARADGRVDRAAGMMASIVMGLGVWVAFGLAWRSIEVFVHLLPCLAMVVLCCGPLRARLARPELPRCLAALAVLAAGFCLPTAAWVLPAAWRLGLSRFLREVFFVGSDAAELYYLSHPAPELYAVATALAVIAVAVIGRAVGRRLVAGHVALLAGVAAVALVGVYAAVFAVMPETFCHSLIWQLENAGFWLAPLANVGGIALLVRGVLGGRGGSSAAWGPDGRGRWLAVVVPLAAAMYLQLYPRADFMHLVTAVPLTVVVASVLLERVCLWWSCGRWPAWLDGKLAVGGVVATVAVAVLAIQASLVLEAPLAGLRLKGPITEAGQRGPAAGLEPAVPAAASVETDSVSAWLEPEVTDDLRAFARTVSYLGERTEPDEPVLAFPALAGVLFAAGLTSPVEHDYWYAGRPSHVDEAAMVAVLESAPPRFVVTLNDGWTFFRRSPEYFEATRRFVTERYRLAARFGRYDVLTDKTEATPGGSVEIFQPEGPQVAAIEPRLAVRRQAARRWMAALTVAEAAAARLPAEPRNAVLLLRALRDGGDLRGGGWVLAGYRSSHAVVRHEALTLMPYLLEDLALRRGRWADDFDASAYRAFLAPHAATARTLLTADDPRVVAFASTLLSLVEGTAE